MSKDGQTTGSVAPTLEGSSKDLLGYYRSMALIRAFELRASEMYAKARIGGYCHLNLGEEAAVVGLASALERGDYLFTTYRDHGFALARGMSAKVVMAELFGRATGCSGGWGGSMHLFDAGLRFMGGYGIVGGQIPPATGAAMAIAYKGEPGPQSEAVMCVLGDGATNIGAFHESLNLASIWKVPIVYVVINNGLGMGTVVDAASGEPDLYKRGCAYRIEGVRVDGDDPVAVKEAAASALAAARTERRPSIIEAMCSRLRGHSVVDPARYRTPEEVELARKADPLPALRSRLIEAGVLDGDAASQIDAGAEREVDEAVAFAEESPFPDVSTLFANTYATEVPNILRALPGELALGWPGAEGRQ
jgi:pyruvate dehydrogenase E1 component alpha subunit